jgi:hypothetical protein
VTTIDLRVPLGQQLRHLLQIIETAEERQVIAGRWVNWLAISSTIGASEASRCTNRVEI